MAFWEWANAHGAGLTAIATVALVLATIATLWVAGRDSHRRNRPMISASFVNGEHSWTTLEFQLKNYGVTRAEDIHVTFDPPLPDVDGAETIRLRYANLIPVLNAGEALVNAWYSRTFAESGEISNQLGLPDTVKVTVTYKRGRRRTYTDVTSLDVRSHLFSEAHVSSDSALGSVRSIAKALREISSKIR